MEGRWRSEGRDSGTGVVGTAAGPLHRRRLHEWLGVDEAATDACGERGSKAWMPAVAVLMDAAARAWQDGGGLVVWIGRVVWPYAATLPAMVSADSVLVHPTPEERLWVIDLALRSQAVTAVVADGSGLGLRATRRLQLAAEAGRAVGMLARPGHEASQRSAAAYRWVVRTAPGEANQGDPRQPELPRWEVEMIRGKDAAVAQGGPGVAGVTWSLQSTRRVVEWRHEGLVTVPAVVADRAAQAVARGRRGA